MVKMDYKLKVTYLGLLMLYLTIDWTSCLDNGLALTPPMGWLSWERYRCNIDCDNDPDNCISEKLYMRMADLLVSKGYKDKGYVYVNIDDCWMEKQRDSNGSLVPDRQRFPHGIKWLADYVHSKGLKLGIYEDMGTYTCEGYPGSEFYLQQDAETFASWGIDSVKLDGCNSAISDLAFGYTAMSKFMNRTGRPMLYSCSWPAYVVFDGKIPDYKNIADNCNLWRNYRDIEDSWDSVSDIIQYYGNDTGNFSMVAGPGNFNDPDMLILGDYSLSYDQQKVQMAMWAIMASPLYISADLANIQPQAQALLQNDNIIKINQDPLGIQGRRIMKNGDVEIWTKTLVNKGMAFAFLNHNQYGGPVKVTVTISSLGLNAPFGYNIVEGFSGNNTGTFRPQDNFTMQVDPSGVWLGIATVSP